jgi:hypothetical protein
MASLARSPNYGEADELLWRQLLPPEEDKILPAPVAKRSGFRWFRSDNVVPIEKYQRSTAKAGGQRAA